MLIVACQKDDSIIENNFQSTKKEKIANFQLVPNTQLNKSKSFKNALSKLSTNSKVKSNNENTNPSFQNEDPNAINGLPLQPWSWTQFYYYFSLQGLGNTQAYQIEIGSSTIKSTNMFDYNT